MWRFCVFDFLPDIFLLFTTSTLALASTGLRPIPPMVLWEPQVTEVSVPWSACYSVAPLCFSLDFSPMIFNFRLTIDFNWRRETWDGNNLWLRSLRDYPELLDVTVRPVSVSEKRTQGWCLWGPEYCLNKCPTWCINCHVSKNQPQVPGHNMTDSHCACLPATFGHGGPRASQAVSSWSHIAMVTPGWITSIPGGERSSGVSSNK